MGFSNSPLVSYTKLTSKNYGARPGRIDRISIHCIVGQWTAKQGCDYFCSTDRSCSVNYVCGKDGSIGLNVEEKNGAWTTSSKANDIRAVTIETASDTTEPYAVTDAAYSALLDLVTDICKRNGAKKLIWINNKDVALAYTPAADEIILTVHRWFANKSCPGTYLMNKMGEIASTVTGRLGGSTDTPLQTVSSYPSCPFTVQVLIDDLNIRKSAGMGDNLTGSYTGKGIYTITEVNGDWGKLKSGAGWIYLANPSYTTIRSSLSNTVAEVTITNEPTTSSDYAKVWKALSEWIDNDFGIAGLMGNLYAESGIVAANLQNSYEKSLGLSDGEYTQQVDSGMYKNFVKDSAGYGIAQWTYWSRKQALLDFAKSKKSSIGNLDMQLEFLRNEVKSYGLLDELNSAKSVLDASNVILMKYEKPSDQSSAVQLKRAEYGTKFYNDFHKETKADIKYRVQVGAYVDKSNAEAMLAKLKSLGIDGFIVEI